MKDETISLSMKYPDALLTRPDGPELIAHQIWESALAELRRRQLSITRRVRLN